MEIDNTARPRPLSSHRRPRPRPLLEALSHVALRDVLLPLALRGTAMARLCDYTRARHLIELASAMFGAARPLDRARCNLAKRAIALATRDLGWPGDALAKQRTELAHVVCLKGPYDKAADSYRSTEYHRHLRPI